MATPAKCAPSRIDALLASLELIFKTQSDSDTRAAALDRFFALTGGCVLSDAQLAKLGTLTQIAQTQAHAEEKSFDIFGTGIAGLVKRIAIGALGASLVLVGLVMIASDATLTQAANRIGSSIGKAVKS